MGSVDDLIAAVEQFEDAAGRAVAEYRRTGGVSTTAIVELEEALEFNLERLEEEEANE